MPGKYEITGRYSLAGLFSHLKQKPELAYSFIEKAKSGLEKITDPRLRELLEENEHELVYSFDGPVMKIAFRSE